MATDEALVLALREGCQEAMETLVYRYHRPLFGYAHRLVRDYHLAQDLVQETFFRLCQNARRIENPKAIKTWLYKVLTRLVVDRQKLLAKRKETFLDQSTDGDQIPLETGEHGRIVSFAEIIEQREDQRRVAQALQLMDKRQRVVVYLRFYEDLAINEIADVLEIAPGTVKSRLHYGLKVLFKALSQDSSQIEKEAGQDGGRIC